LSLSQGESGWSLGTVMATIDQSISQTSIFDSRGPQLDQRRTQPLCTGTGPAAFLLELRVLKAG